LLLSSRPLQIRGRAGAQAAVLLKFPVLCHFFSNNNVVYSDRSEKLKKKLAIFLERQQ
jgi:hypothetical protein